MMTPTDINKCASQFLNATLHNQAATDEEQVYSVLKEAHDSGLRSQFEAAVTKKLNSYDLEDFTRFKLGSGRTSVLEWIIDDELSGVEKTKAEDLLNIGENTYRSSKIEYLIHGIIAPFDCNVNDFLWVGGVIAAAGVVAMVLPPLAPLMGSALVTVGECAFLYEVVKGGWSVTTGLSDQNDVAIKQGLESFGKAIAYGAPFAKFVEYPIQTRAFAWKRLRLLPQELRIFRTLHHFIKQDGYALGYRKTLTLLEREGRPDLAFSLWQEIGVFPRGMSDREKFRAARDMADQGSRFLERHQPYAEAGKMCAGFAEKSWNPTETFLGFIVERIPFVDRAIQYVSQTQDWKLLAELYESKAQISFSAKMWEETIEAWKMAGSFYAKSKLSKQSKEAVGALEALSNHFINKNTPPRADFLQTKIKEAIAEITSIRG